MFKVNVLFLLGLICFPFQETERLSYATRSALVWSDFKGVPDALSAFVAKTNTGIRYDWTYSTENKRLELSYQVDAYFYPKESWVKPMGKTSEAMLAHEQLYFDITELHARKFRKALREYVLGRNIRRDIHSMYTQIEQKRRQMRRQYESETQLSTDTLAQERWNLMMADSLRHYQAYLN